MKMQRPGGCSKGFKVGRGLLLRAFIRVCLVMRLCDVIVIIMAVVEFLYPVNNNNTHIQILGKCSSEFRSCSYCSMSLNETHIKKINPMQLLCSVQTSLNNYVTCADSEQMGNPQMGIMHRVHDDELVCCKIDTARNHSKMCK